MTFLPSPDRAYLVRASVAPGIPAVGHTQHPTPSPRWAPNTFVAPSPPA